MSHPLRRPAMLVAALALALGSIGIVSIGTANAAPYCGITWGSLAKSGGTPSGAALDGVRTGRHDCFDRVVFDFSGSANGYRVEYVSELRTDGEGRRLAVAGGAILRVRLLANVFDELGHLHYNRTAGDHVANVTGYRTLRDVVFAGCFEGTTTFGVGVRARLPFRVFSLAGPGATSRIVVDVAHAW